MKRKKTKKRIIESKKLKPRRKKAGGRAFKKTLKRAPKRVARKKAKKRAARPAEASAARSETTVAIYEVVETRALEEPNLEPDERGEDAFGT